nr:hypothetical protein [Tatlockia sp.]
LLPTKVEEIPRFLQHIWAFDRLKVTTEDKKRTSLYKENIQRDRLLKESPTLENFLEGLGLQIKIAPPSPQQLERVAQLTQRTNQFNLTTIRRSEQEINHLCQGNYECLVVEVSDRFGDYGLVGVLLFTLDGDTLINDTFLLSCRVLGRGVEYKMLAHLGEIASNRGVAQVKLAYVPSEKNQPALNFLNAVGSEFRQQTATDISWQFPVEYARSLVYNPQANNATETQSVATPIQATKKTAPILSVQQKLTRLSRIATEFHSASQVFEQIQLQKRQRPELQESYAAPRNEIEQQLAQIWNSVLRVDNIGIYDNFFDLGGNSVVAVQLFIQIENIFGKKLPLPTLLQAGTIEQLALVIQRESLDTWSSLIEIAVGNPEQKTPLFCIHAIGGGALYYRDLVEYLDPQQPVYGLEARGLDGQETPSTSIEDMAAYYIQQILTIQPPSSTPYFLAGSSMGGLIAFEIAHQLQNMGQKIGLVALFDTISPIYRQFSFRNQVVNHLKQGYKFTLARIQDRINQLKSQLEQQVRKATGKNQTKFPERTRNFRLEVELSNKRALKSYSPQAYPLQVTLFRAINQPLGASWYFDTQLGWGKLATLGVKTYNVPGNHLTVVEKPQVEMLAAKFEFCLKEAQENSPSDRQQVYR